ncbi:hypothetical protein H2248_011294 [Termitomyces sp. 'cryptogamus']|nr:hypothetical protein H2248_011294 [Termitomyces sp. 'cryptogamus']
MIIIIEEGNSDIKVRVNSGSPGGEPDDPSSSLNTKDISPPRFEPDPWDILTLLYILAAITITQYAFHKRFVLKPLLNCLVSRPSTSRPRLVVQQNGIRELGNATVLVTLKLNMVDELREVQSDPALIGGLLNSISQLSNSSAISISTLGWPCTPHVLHCLHSLTTQQIRSITVPHPDIMRTILRKSELTHCLDR